MNTIKTIFYMGSLHGFFTFYFPYQLSVADKSLFEFGVFRYLASPLWLIGALIIIWCSVDIIRRGRGTPAHVDPPKILIVNGLYRHVRNPIYFGAMLVLLGYVLWFVSPLLMLYSALAFIGFNLLVIVIEEPVLKNMFGGEYVEYSKRVPRWLPRLSK